MAGQPGRAVPQLGLGRGHRDQPLQKVLAMAPISVGLVISLSLTSRGYPSTAQAISR